ncbi:hypothetical protein [Afipia sp. DC4300-2b1]|uniref:hypothetical protein n=1 Tax=Afipia sp. DC4300-2b1 TaxID=2804672 RepID=UPI003CE8F934
MEWSTIALLMVGAVFLVWWNQREEKGSERAEAASDRLKRDNSLYKNIKTGMREINWLERDRGFRRHRNGEVIFENAHMIAYHVEHFAESRVGFYFKDLNEYGLYGFFAGNGDDFFESYYRTDKAFQDEGRLLHDED